MKKLFLILILLFSITLEVQQINAKPNLSIQNNNNEEDKIVKLILFIEKSNAVFIRNGNEYDAKEAADHLRMKRKKAGNKVKTAKDFIDQIASKSSMSGEAYKMKFKNGSILNTRDILYVELRKIERTIK
jgi:hypothetical protein